MGFRGATHGEKERKAILLGSAILDSAEIFLIYCLRAAGDEWQIRRDDLESEIASR